MRTYSIVALASILSLAAAGQNSTPPKYDDQDAYEIYNLLLPSEQSYAFAKGALVIQQETAAPG